MALVSEACDRALDLVPVHVMLVSHAVVAAAVEEHGAAAAAVEEHGTAAAAVEEPGAAAD